MPAICLAGSVKPLIQQCMEKYAQKVATTGQYLDLADAQLMAEEHLGEVVLIIDDVNLQGPLLLAETLAEMVPGLQKEGSEINRSSKQTWVLVSCCATFEAGADRNHWIPGFFREQLGDPLYEHLTKGSIDEEAAMMETIQAELTELDDSGFSGLEPTEVAIKASQISELGQRLATSLTLKIFKIKTGQPTPFVRICSYSLQVFTSPCLHIYFIL